MILPFRHQVHAEIVNFVEFPQNNSISSINHELLSYSEPKKMIIDVLEHFGK